MPNLSGYIASIIIGVIVGLILRSLEAKPKVVYWSPHNFFFDLSDIKVMLQTNSLTIQNIGRKAAENVEIIHKEKPDFFQFAPAVVYEEDKTPTGEHVLRIKSLGSKEFFMLQLLSYAKTPILLNVRSKDGPAKLIQIRPQRTYPKWLLALFGFFMYIGIGFVAYWLIKAVVFVSKSIGIV